MIMTGLLAVVTGMSVVVVVVVMVAGMIIVMTGLMVLAGFGGGDRYTLVVLVAEVL